MVITRVIIIIRVLGKDKHAGPFHRLDLSRLRLKLAENWENTLAAQLINLRDEHHIRDWRDMMRLCDAT